MKKADISTMSTSAPTDQTTAPATTRAPERIAAVSRRPANLGQTPAGAVSLAMGEPDATTAPRIVAAANTSLDSGRTHYAPASGLPELREAIAARAAQQTGRPTEAAEVTLTHGASAALAALILALVRPGDRVVLSEPTYSLYADHVALVDADAVWVPGGSDGSTDLTALAAAVPSARMVILCNPSNPTGLVMDADQMAHLEAIIAAHPETLLVCDEAYSEIVFDGVPFTSALSLQSIRAQTIQVGTFSKTYAMTGWRLGYTIAPQALAARIDLVHRTVNGSLCTFVQDAALQAIATPAEELEAMRVGYQRRRDLVVKSLAGMQRVTVRSPQGAFYAFPRIDSALTSAELVEEFARGGVLVRAGSEYGESGEGHVRISFAADEESLRTGLERFGRVVAALPR